MNNEEFQIAVISIVFGSVVALTFLIVIGSIIKSWIKKKSGPDLADNEEFLEALRHFKKKTDRRLSNLEAMVIDDESLDKKAILPPEDRENIEYNERGDEEKSGGNLKNMLKK